MSGQMNEPVKEKRELELVPACRHLRHKLMYCDSRQEQPGMVDVSSDTTVFFCGLTLDALGPDDEPSGPKLCGSGRHCFCDGEA